MTDRRFIEESFPVKEVGEISAKEKNIRHGHISTLHIWWARRPLAASRATAYAALVPPPKDIQEWQKQRDFIIELSQWKNSNNTLLLEKARRDILQAHAARLSGELGVPVSVEDIEAGKYPRPRVIDPFAGGGSYPLEALRLGCETYASDYNPVAVLIEKATLEYPQKFGRLFERMPEWALPRSRKFKGEQLNLMDVEQDETELKDFNPLLNAVRYWGKWVLEEARKELAEFYPLEPDSSIPVGYIWARTIPCQNPNCGQDIPLMRQFWLARKSNKKIALRPIIIKGNLLFQIIGDGYAPWPKDFSPDQGTVSHAIATCPLCGSIIDGNTIRKLFQEHKSGQKLIAVVYTKCSSDSKRSGGDKHYRLATASDEATYRSVQTKLEVKQEQLTIEWGMSAIPDEPTPEGKGSGAERAFSVRNYGLNVWGDLFNSRQKLALITFTEKIRSAYSKMLVWNGKEFCKAVITYLAINLDRLVDKGATLCIWSVTDEYLAHVFGRQTLPITWDYFEFNPFSESTGDWLTALGYIEKPLEHCTQIENYGIISQSSATNLQFQENYFDAIFTDPPYYDNVPYSYLSDFFYVWLKRTIGAIYPDLVSTPLTPKTQEIVAYSYGIDGFEGGKRFFEENLKHAFQEIYRILKPNGVSVIVYAHKSTEGWETVINALLDSSLVITGAWPLNTEMQNRMRASESAALTSSIYIVARKTLRQPTGFYNDVRTELRQHLDAKLHRLWEEGIGGADFFIAAIGSAIEVFGKYEKVMDYEGNVVRAHRLLEEVRTIATDYAVRQILHDGFATEISGLIRLYVLWRWNYGEVLVPFDEGRKLAQSCGVDLSQEWNKGGFIKKEKGFIRVLGPQLRKLDDLEEPRNMIDVLHKALLLWEKGKRAEMVQALVDREYGKSEAFFRVAQAISETLTNESKEKKLLDGFLAGRERVQEEVEKAAEQGRLFE